MQMNRVIVALVVLVLLGLVLFFSFTFSGNVVSTSENYDSLVKCMKDNNVILYGYGGDNHVAAQKKLFGDSAEKITYVDCYYSPEKCHGIIMYPSWRIGEVLLSGAATPGTISHFSGCDE